MIEKLELWIVAHAEGYSFFEVVIGPSSVFELYVAVPCDGAASKSSSPSSPLNADVLMRVGRLDGISHVKTGLATAKAVVRVGVAALDMTLAASNPICA